LPKYIDEQIKLIKGARALPIQSIAGNYSAAASTRKITGRWVRRSAVS
jgi:hypothetical protein